jgi:hypothetical protein
VPLTATCADQVIDATACDDAAWEMIYKVRPRAVLLCRACAQQMHAKVSARATRFFAHDRRVPECPAAGETALHRVLKAALADAIRASGWVAVVEALPTADDVGGWRADVLAVDEDSGRRVAFEVQLAAMTISDGEARTARYAGDAVETVWLTTRNARWLWSLPGCQLAQDSSEPPGPAAFAATRGLAKLVDEAWTFPPPVALARLVAGVLAGTISPCTIDHICEEIAHGDETRPLWHFNATGLVPTAHVARARRLAAEKARAQARVSADIERHRSNIQALYARQQRVLPIAAAHAAEALAGGEYVWAGVPATRLRADDAVDFRNAAGNDTTARAAAIWVGRDRDALRLFAVCSPVASLITPGLAASWRRRRVRVYVAEQGEAKRVAAALRCGMADLHLVDAAR